MSFEVKPFHPASGL